MLFKSLIPVLLWTTHALAAPNPEANAKALELEALADSIESFLQPRQQTSRLDAVAGNVFAARDVCQGRMSGIEGDLGSLPLSGDAASSLRQYIQQYTNQWAGLRQTLSNIANGLRRLAAAGREGENINRPW